MQAGSWGYTWRDGCCRSRESGLSRGFVRTDLQATVHLHLASWAGLYTWPASTHTHSHSHRLGRESVACAPQPVCPANTAELSPVAVATRQQGCSMSSALRTILIPKPLPESKTFNLSVLALYSFVTLPEQSQTIPHVLTLDILDTELKPTVHKLEFKNGLPTLFAYQLSVYLPVYPSVYWSICLSIHHPFVYLS